MPTITALPITERQFTAQVIQLARLNHWACYHTFDSRRSEPGFPDLCLVRPPRLIFAELKVGHGRLTTAQSAWLEALRQAPGCEVAVWKPGDWEQIVATLAQEG